MSQVCRCCYGLDAEKADDDASFDRVEMTVGVMRLVEHFQAAAKACAICGILLRIMLFFGVSQQAQSKASVMLILPVGPGNAHLMFQVDGNTSVVQLYSSIQPTGTWTRIRPLPDVCTHQLSSQGLGFINMCLQTCLRNHALCNAPMPADSKFPSRLIFVGRAGHPALRIVETGDTSPGPFTALSYSWGGAVTTKTNLANLEQMKQNIPMDTLQATMADAIALTRALGIEYIWVDALCIVQDSKQDWEKESTKMASLYAHAVLTIASVSSKSAAMPFLHPEIGTSPPKHALSVFSETVDASEEPVVIKARLVNQAGIHWRWQNDSERRIPKEPWSQRGWTLQEQILPRRLLMISSSEMQWVCKQAETCECLSTFNRRRQFGGVPLAQLKGADETFRFWHKLIENYTVRNLTDKSDKLPAISGIAEVVQQKTRSGYVAGLWEMNIDLDLLWRKTGDLDVPDNRDLSAPSFSWASVNGEVDYYCFRNGRLPYRRTTTVDDIVTSPSVQAPLGKVSGGMMTVTGPLVECRITRYCDAGAALVQIAGREVEISIDAHLGYLTKDSERYACRRDDGSDGVEPLLMPNPYTRKLHRLSHPPRCWILKMGEFEPQQYKKGEWGSELMILGLSPSQSAFYQRIGFAVEIVRGLNEHFGQSSVSSIRVV